MAIIVVLIKYLTAQIISVATCQRKHVNLGGWDCCGRNGIKDIEDIENGREGN